MYNFRNACLQICEMMLTSYCKGEYSWWWHSYVWILEIITHCHFKKMRPSLQLHLIFFTAECYGFFYFAQCIWCFKLQHNCIFQESARSFDERTTFWPNEVVSKICSNPSCLRDKYWAGACFCLDPVWKQIQQGKHYSQGGIF